MQRKSVKVLLSTIQALEGGASLPDSVNHEVNNSIPTREMFVKALNGHLISERSTRASYSSIARRQTPGGSKPVDTVRASKRSRP